MNLADLSASGCGCPSQTPSTSTGCPWISSWRSCPAWASHLALYVIELVDAHFKLNMWAARVEVQNPEVLNQEVLGA